ncbi:MAG: ATP-binding cassette domain-containing protein [bacterium]
MTTPLLTIENLEISVGPKIVLNGIDLNVGKGEMVMIIGPNGGGKSSLANFLMGNPNYLLTNNHGLNPTLQFDQQDLLTMSTEQRSKAGLFVSWQNPISIPGLSVFSLCKTSYEVHGNKIHRLVEFKKMLEELAIEVGLTKEYVSRNVNDGFSGGERKRLELLQLLLLSPKLAVLDEIDSGLDTQGINILIRIISQMKILGTSFILITHNEKLRGEIKVDQILEMKNGRLSARI